MTLAFLRGCRPGSVCPGLILLIFGCALLGQDPSESTAPVPTQSPTPAPPTPLAPATRTPPSVSEKWHLFEHEATTPLILGAAGFNAAVSQTIHSVPLYGRHAWPTAYPKRFGAAIGDILSQDFFGDFLLASAFHEDTRYVRRGPTHKFFGRLTYAVSRAVVTRTDAGDATFNWANFFGTAMSAGLSNAYYPAVSRNATAAAKNWGITLADSGFANLLPELWPDFRRWVKRQLHPYP
jgi:hypothetical protein